MDIKELFFEEPMREFGVREVARSLKIAPTTASKKLRSLFKEGFIEHKKERIYDLYRANRENEIFKDLKKNYGVKKIRDSGLIKELNKFYGKPSIILFGSVAKGEDTSSSDLDLVIISEKIKEFPQKKQFEKRLKRDIQMFVVKEIKELRNKHLINNVLNGLVLQGEIKWI